MNENSQLELFAPSQKIFGSKEYGTKDKFSFRQIKIYEKRIIIFVVILITGIASFSLGVEKGKRFAKMPDPVNIQAKTEIAPQTAVEPKIKEKTEAAVSTTAPKESLQYYTIQLASYQNRSSAEQEAETLKRKGFLPLVVNKGKYTILCTGNFPDKKNALSLLPELRERYRDCFIRRL